MKRKHKVTLTVAVVVIALNALVAMHARAMLHFNAEGRRTKSPEALSLAEKLGVALTGVEIPKPKARHKPETFDLHVDAVTIPGDGGALAGWSVRAPVTWPWVLMLHGYVAEHSMLYGEAKEFLALGYQPFLLDFRASGGSAGFDTTIGYREADDVMRAYAYLRAQSAARPIVIYGKSMGGAAALRAAGPLGLKPRALILESVFDSLLNTVKNRFAIVGAPATPLAEWLVAWGSLLYGFNGFAHNPADYATSVTVPTLLMVGDQDRRATPDDARAIHAGLAGDKTLRIFEGAGHNDLYSDDPARWRSTVSDFLAARAP